MILKVDNIYKSFAQAESGLLEILKGVSFKMEQGETLAIAGQSGSGKTTLLSLLAGLDSPDSGSVILDGEDLNRLNEDRLAKFRASKIGMIFQQFHLMPHLTAAENISLPLEILKSRDIEERTSEALKQVGLENRRHHLPGHLSGGECQRVAIARALVVKPAILLADELTGNLDSRTGNQVADLLFDLVDSIHMTLILVSHNLELAGRCQRQSRLADGKLQ
ncbi:MAG: ABC transporter ATP-binding protein [Deltaproteobacteria bacterium]|nr:ABC transporter ATP-binding protein [Deltaproteobacteria bacterium]